MVTKKETDKERFERKGREARERLTPEQRGIIDAGGSVTRDTATGEIKRVLTAEERENLQSIRRRGGTPISENVREALTEIRDPARARELEQQKQTEQAKEELPGTFEEAGVFKDVEQERIIPPEQENLGVMGRILKAMIPASLDTSKGLLGDRSALNGTIFNRVEKGEPVSQAEITMLEDDLKEEIKAETSAEIDQRLQDTEETLMANGISLTAIGTGIGAIVVASAVRQPVGEFIGTDGQIASLENALSQYNEMTVLPARGVKSGSLDPQKAFDKYDRMEEQIFQLEQQLKLSAQESTKVALALRGRALEARLLKLKEKIQDGRREVALVMTSEAFGEIEIPQSVSFLRSLQNERTQKTQD